MLQLLGMSSLVSILASAFVSIVEFFAKFFTKKVAVSLAGITGLVAVTGTFTAAVYGLLSGIQYVVPNYGPVFLFLPDNLPVCLGVIVSAYVMRFVYDWNVNMIQLRLF